MILCLTAVTLSAGILHRFHRADRRAKEEWSNLAREVGLSLGAGSRVAPKRLSGTYRGRFLRLEPVFVGVGRYSAGAEFTRIALDIGMPESLRRSMRERGVLDWFSQAIGAKSANIGEKGFDDRFAVRSAPGGFAASVFSSTSRRHKIVQLPHIRRMRVKDTNCSTRFRQECPILKLSTRGCMQFGGSCGERYFSVDDHIQCYQLARRIVLGQ